MVDIALIVIACIVPVVLIFANLVIIARYVDPSAAAGHYIAKLMIVSDGVLTCRIVICSHVCSLLVLSRRLSLPAGCYAAERRRNGGVQVTVSGGRRQVGSVTASQRHDGEIWSTFAVASVTLAC